LSAAMFGCWAITLLAGAGPGAVAVQHERVTEPEELTEEEGFLASWFGESFSGEGDHERKIETMEEHIFVFFVFAVLMFVAAAFKIFQSWVHRKRPKDTSTDADSVVWNEMLHAYFEEVSIMGAVGATVLFAQRNYLVGDVVKLLASRLSVTEEELIEVLEGVHCLVFLILAWMIGLTLGIGGWIRWTTGQWTQEETRFLSLLRSQSDSDREWKKSGVAKLRRAFIRRVDSNLVDDVDEELLIFSKYLQCCLVGTLEDIIRLPYWIMLPPFAVGWLIFPFYEKYYNMQEEREDVHGLYIMICAAAVVLGMMLVVTWQVRRVLWWITPTNFDDDCVAPYVEHWKSKEADAEGSQTGGKAHKTSGCAACVPDFLLTWVCGTSTPKAGERVFWFWVRGPGFLTTLVQLSLFFLALIPSVYELVLSPQLKYRHKKEFGAFLTCTLAAYFLVVYNVPRLAMITKLGDFTDMKLRRKVIDESPGKKFLPQLTTPISRKLVQALKYEHVLHTFDGLSVDQKRDRLHALAATFDGRPDLLKSYIRYVFNKFDTDDSNTLHRDEVEQCLMSEGYSQARAKQVVDDYFPIFDLDESGELDEEEFLALHVILVQSIKEVTIADITPQTCMHVCRRYDLNKDNLLEMDEFVVAMSQMLQVEMASEDIQALWGIIDKSSKGDSKVDLKAVANFFFRVCQCLGQAETVTASMSTVDVLKRTATAFKGSSSGLGFDPE